MTFARDLEGMLWPERFPPGHPRHDGDHIYWSGGEHEHDSEFQWSGRTITWVAEAVETQIELEEAGT